MEARSAKVRHSKRQPAGAQGSRAAKELAQEEPVVLLGAWIGSVCSQESLAPREQALHCIGGDFDTILLVLAELALSVNNAVIFILEGDVLVEEVVRRVAVCPHHYLRSEGQNREPASISVIVHPSLVEDFGLPLEQKSLHALLLLLKN